jgi:hypothetical protein
MIFSLSKPKIFIILIISFTLIFSSCSPIIGLFLGVKDFKNETKQEFVRIMKIEQNSQQY